MGFDNECILNIQTLAGEYFCPVCRMLVYPNEALQSQCTHLYCKPCLTYIVNTTKACPYDGYLVTQEDSKPLAESNKALAETIGNITVHCLYHKSGCLWQGPLSDCSSHCSGCAFGNSSVVCNRCSLQIVHRQVEEHAQNCLGLQSQSQTGEGALNPSTIKDQMQAATGVVQAQASLLTAAAVPGEASSQSATNPNPPLVAQGATDSLSQQQNYQQYAEYYPYQQQYLQYYQQLYQQHHAQRPPPLQPPLQTQFQLPSQAPATSLVQTLPQAQQPLLSHIQPQSQPMPFAQAHPQSQALAAGLQQQSHPILSQHSFSHPLSDIPAQGPISHHSQLHTQAPPHSQPQTDKISMPQYQQNHPQAQPHPQFHPQAQPSSQLSQHPQIYTHPHPSQPNHVTQYQPIHPSTGHHSYPQQSRLVLSQQNSNIPYPQGGQQQQFQRPVQVQNQTPQQLVNPHQPQGLNQNLQYVQQNYMAPQQTAHTVHHRLSVQSGSQPMAPYSNQQQGGTTPAQMHSQLRPRAPLLVPQQSHFYLQPLKNHVLPHNAQPNQSQSHIRSASGLPETNRHVNLGVGPSRTPASGFGQQSAFQTKIDNQRQSTTEQRSSYLQPSVGSQSAPGRQPTENGVALGHLDNRKTSLMENKPTKASSASENGMCSQEKGINEDVANGSLEHICAERSGLTISEGKSNLDLKEVGPLNVNTVNSGKIEPYNQQSASGTNKRSPDESFSFVLSSEKHESKASVTGLVPDSEIRLCQQQFRSNVPRVNINQPPAPLNHMPSGGLQGEQIGGPFPHMHLDSHEQMMARASSHLFEGHISRSTGLDANSKYFVGGRQAGPDTVPVPGWQNKLKGAQEYIDLEQGQKRGFQKDLKQYPKPPDMKHAQFPDRGNFSSSKFYEGGPFGIGMMPRPVDLALHGLHHDRHMRPEIISEDSFRRPDVRHPTSVHDHQLVVPYKIPNRVDSHMASKNIWYGDSRAQFRLGINGRAHNLCATSGPHNLPPEPAGHSFISNRSPHLPPHIHQGPFGSLSGHPRSAELSRHVSIPPNLGEFGIRSNFLVAENKFYKGELEQLDSIRKRNAAAGMGWCRICKVDCETVEGLDLHSQTRQHQKMSMDLVLSIKEQNLKRQKMISNVETPAEAIKSRLSNNEDRGN